MYAKKDRQFPQMFLVQLESLPSTWQCLIQYRIMRQSYPSIIKVASWKATIFGIAIFLAIIVDIEITDGLDGDSWILVIACNHIRD